MQICGLLFRNFFQRMIYLLIIRVCSYVVNFDLRALEFLSFCSFKTIFRTFFLSFRLFLFWIDAFIIWFIFLKLKRVVWVIVRIISSKSIYEIIYVLIVFILFLLLLCSLYLYSSAIKDIGEFSPCFKTQLIIILLLERITWVIVHSHILVLIRFLGKIAFLANVSFVYLMYFEYCLKLSNLHNFILELLISIHSFHTSIQ